MLSKKVIAERVAEFEALEAQIKELEALRDAAKDELTAELDRRGVEELTVGNKTVRWTAYVSSRFDSSAFKKAQPDEYARWQKQVTGHRFSVA